MNMKQAVFKRWNLPKNPNAKEIATALLLSILKEAFMAGASNDIEFDKFIEDYLQDEEIKNMMDDLIHKISEGK